MPAMVIPNVRSWAIWQLRRPAIGYLLVVEAAALVLLAWSLRHGVKVDGRFWRAVLLAAMAVLYGEASDRIERVNRYLSAEGATVNQNSVFLFAGVSILPSGLAASLTVLVYVHTYLRYRRWRMAAPHKELFTAALALLSAFAANAIISGAQHHFGYIGAMDALRLLAAIAAYTSVNLVLLLICLRLVTGARWRDLLPGRQAAGYETATLLFGAFTGVLILHAPWLSPLVLFLIASLHRASLVTNLQQRARTDARTGLLNAGGWQAVARQHLAQCGERMSPAAVLLVDLDHFKAVNDTHGHLAGDEVLKEVAEILGRELRGYDAVGRYGGEEFIALLPGVSGRAAAAIGERLRERIASNTSTEGIAVTASIGVAASQAGRTPALEDIIDAADTALYEAKATGRNRVCLAPPVQLREPVLPHPDRRDALLTD
ncbi:MAG TPA: GGDEF domain-containing protein [Jatrophihabitans sp.]|nr:GGDEF domain-containing protein [Jatrophihabitans sp.]